jgi:hypothetical protein
MLSLVANSRIPPLKNLVNGKMAKTTVDVTNVNSLVYERNVKYFLHGIRKPTGRPLS